MVIIPDEYVGSSCVIKSTSNDLLTMGTLHKIKDTYIDINSSRNELPEIPYNMVVKVEIYNTKLGFRVLVGNVYLSTSKIARIINLTEATNDERRQYFRISSRSRAVILRLSHKYVDENGNTAETEYLNQNVQLVDISLGGLMFKSGLELAIGDGFDIVIEEMRDSMIYNCIIRRRVPRADSLIGYGCEFMDMTNLQEDLLYKYILKRQNDQLRRIR